MEGLDPMPGRAGLDRQVRRAGLEHGEQRRERVGVSMGRYGDHGAGPSAPLRELFGELAHPGRERAIVPVPPAVRRAIAQRHAVSMVPCHGMEAVGDRREHGFGTTEAGLLVPPRLGSLVSLTMSVFVATGIRPGSDDPGLSPVQVVART
jgi:hypothetical protein